MIRHNSVMGRAGPRLSLTARPGGYNAAACPCLSIFFPLTAKQPGRSFHSSTASARTCSKAVGFACRCRRSEVSFPEVEHRPLQVYGTGAVADAVLTHRVDHLLEELAGLDKGVGECLRVLRMHVVVVGAVDEQEATV